MRFGFSSIAAMAALLAMAACSSHERAQRARPVFSPNGEILSAGGKGAPTCPEAMAAWWDRMAAAHGGVFTRETLVADANTQFDAMDLDHDGFITPSELSDYRAALDEPPTGMEAVLPPAEPSADTQMHTHRKGDNYVQPKIRAAQIPADVVDPVMSADKSLSFKVSREDFITQANEVFTDLNKSHDGKLSKAELLESCPAR